MKKIGLIALVLVMALGAMGVGYAAWSQNLTINGTVTTGQLSAIFVNFDESNDFTDNRTPSIMMGSIAPNADDPTLLDVVIINAYPGGSITIPMNIQNNGDVPVTVSISTTLGGGDSDKFSITGSSDPAGTIGVGETNGTGTVTITASAVEGDILENTDPDYPGSYSITISLTANQNA